MEINKRTVKALNREIEQIRLDNEISNEYGALIDFGEWSHSDPNFSEFMERHQLTEQDIEAMFKLAGQHESTFYKMYPNNAPRPQYEVEYKNPWMWIRINLGEVLYFIDCQKRPKHKHFS